MRLRDYVVNGAPEFYPIGNEPCEDRCWILGTTRIPAIVAGLPDGSLQFAIFDDFGPSDQSDITLVRIVLVKQRHPARALYFANLAAPQIGEHIDGPIVPHAQGLDNPGIEITVLSVRHGNTEGQFVNKLSRKFQ
jgi:hypothetical protein